MADMNFLCLDAGNSSIKVTPYNNGKGIIGRTEKVVNDVEVRRMCQEYNTRVVVASSVSEAGFRLMTDLKKHVEVVDIKELPLPFKVNLDVPGSLGADRIAAIAGAIGEFGERNMLIVDMGTAITYEFYSAAKGYLGGYISAGVQLRFSALNNFTSLLPLIDVKEAAPFEGLQMGISTYSAMYNGVFGGVVGEIEYNKNYMKTLCGGDFITVLTGGDVKNFSFSEKDCNFVRPNLVVDGLACILQKQYKTE